MEKERKKIIWPEEKEVRATGMFEYETLSGKKIVGLSANSWSEYKEMVELVADIDSLAVCPELITMTGIEFCNVNSTRELIESRIGELVKMSFDKPKVTFLLSTPLFGGEKPANSVLLIKNGNCLGVGSKRFGATTEENEAFEMVPEDKPLFVPDTRIGVVICADLGLATMYGRIDKQILKEVLRLGGKDALIGKNVNIVDPNMETVVVVACWSVGGKWLTEGSEDEYYMMQLRNISYQLMKNSNVKEIIVVDRVPECYTCTGWKATAPYNVIFRSSE